MSGASANTQTSIKELSIIDSIMQTSRYSKEDESYNIAKMGVAEFITEIVKTDNAENKINKYTLDEMIAHIDDIISRQMDEILHNEQIQQLESTWRGLYFLVERTNFQENIKINLFDVTKQEALEDFEANPDITTTTLF